MASIAAAGIGAVAGAGQAGYNLLRNVVDDATAAIILDNGTNFTLTHLKTISGSGKIKEQLPPSLPRGSYVMATTGNTPSLRGTDGMVTLGIDGTGLAIAIVWFVPLFTGYNRLTIGIYEAQNIPNPDSIVELVKRKRQHQGHLSAFLKFASKDYKDSIVNVELNHVVNIKANMNNHKSGRVIIEIRENGTVLENAEQGKEELPFSGMFCSCGGSKTDLFPTHQTLHDETRLVQNGESFQGGNIDDLFSQTKLRVVGIIDITNITSYKLTKSKIHTDGGRCSVLPRDVGPLKREAVVVHKHPFTATGSYGTVSFYIKDLDCRVVLMWSIPFNQDFYSNYLALDMTRGPELDHSKLFNKLYRREGVVRTKYDKGFGETSLSDNGITLTALMTRSHRSHIQLKIEMTQEKEPGANA